MPAYDNYEPNIEALLDLPFREGVGTVTHDVARPHHPVALLNTPTWAWLASGLGAMAFNGTNEHLRSLGADTADLDFADGDYSIGLWFYDDSGCGDDSEELINRFLLNNNGWELYLYTNQILTLRHHHAAGATTRTACYSEGWAPDVWNCVGISRSGATAQFYRNGEPVDTTCSVGGMIDPEGCAANLYVASQGAGNWFGGQMWRPRVWNRALSADEWRLLYRRERRWFP